MLMWALPLLLCAVATSASAASVSHPDGEGGCRPAEYNDDNWQFSVYTWFAVPAMANGESVSVGGTSVRNGPFGTTYDYPWATFYCDNGVISTNNPYDFYVTWSLY